MDSLTAQYWQLPTLSRTLTTVVFCLSLSVWVGPLSYSPFVYEPARVGKFPPEVWRLVTGFLLTQPQLGLIFDTFHVYTGIQRLEVANPRFPRRVDVIWYLIFVCSTILMINKLFYYPSPLMLHPLLLALAYTGTQDMRGAQINYFFINIPAQMLPYGMLFVSLLLGGPPALLLDLHGLVAAHLYDFLIRLWPQFGGGPNLIAPPQSLVNLVEGQPRRGGSWAGTSSSPASGSSTGVSRGPLPDSWRTRGSGHRLG
jgi:Derlin-2/3